MSAAGKEAKRSASGQAAVKASRKRHFDDTGGDLEEFEPKGGELGPGQFARGGNGVADCEHEPIAGGVLVKPFGRDC